MYHMGDWSWRLEWRRLWSEWEENLLTNFMQVFNTITLRRDNQDGWCWNSFPISQYYVKDVYDLILQNQDHRKMVIST